MGGLAKKTETVQEIQESLKDATVALVVDYRGLTVSDLTKIRRELSKNNARLTVVKNTLLRRAISGGDMEGLTPFLKGPTALAVGKADQVAPIKVLKTFFKENKKTDNDIRGGLLDGKAISVAEIEQLSTLPPLNELRGKLVCGIASPLNGIVAAISGPQRGLVSVLDQLAKRKAQ